jgi:hypothetical protein
MTSVEAGPHRDLLGLLGRQADHRDAEQVLLAAGWTVCGAGDWAIALRSPDGAAAARISPFDPTGPYSATLYREAAHTRQVPEQFTHRRLTGGGDLQVLEWLRPVPSDARDHGSRGPGRRCTPGSRRPMRERPALNLTPTTSEPWVGARQPAAPVRHIAGSGRRCSAYCARNYPIDQSFALSVS